MLENWKMLYKNSFGGRQIELYQYESGELRVVTTQKDTEVGSGTYEPGSALFPLVVSAGSPIHIEANTADELVVELQDNGFTEREAKEIARHGRVPNIEPDTGVA